MNTVAKILEAVKHLPQDQKEEFLDGPREIEFEDDWNRQIEADAATGRLETFWLETLIDIKAGRAKALDEVLKEFKFPAGK